MNKAILKLSADWADEFQCEQFVICENRSEAVNRRDSAIKYGGWFGTNEGWEGGQLRERDFEIVEVSDKEAEILQRVLGSGFGTGIL